MATNATWTVVFDDKLVIKQSGDAAGTFYIIDDNAFWDREDYSNFWAIQYGTSPSSDEVEHKDGTAHTSWESTGLSFSEFTNKWDAAHLAKLQSDWDNDNIEGESEADKISRLGARPTSYTS